ncbi:hypothetical protein PRNP1_000244 [Phytophthora ramorum]
MSVGVTIGVACGIALLFALFFAWLARRSFKKFEREVELNTPLIDSDDRRLDAALRDAEEGFIVCDFCAFENFKRVRFCTLCGEPIVEKAPFSCRSPSRNKGERRSVFKDSMESLAIIPLQNARSVVRINFLDENGVDAGGLQREWFVMLNEALVDPVRGLFVCANKNEQAYFLSPCSNMDLLPDRLLHLYAAGRLLGRALLEGSMLCFHLASPLLKLILGYPLSFEDLEDLDPEVYSNLRWLLENDNVDALDLDFTVTTKDGDSYRDIELVPGGSAIPVTDSNKREFVELKWQYLLVESVAPQLQVFLQGLYEIVPRELLLLFDPEEFDFLLCGSDEIDVDDWERNTKYSEDLHHHRSLKWFWELVREMPNEYRRRLLQFSTGSSRVPLGGFSALTSYDGRLCPFTLKAVSLIGDGFIHSHACFNRLDLPLHVVRDELTAVLYAVLETEVYGFTTD